jgi:putative ABC transport system permease protein
VTGLRASRLVRAVLRLLAPPGDADALIRDLEDEAGQIAAASGARAARRWRRWQAVHSIGPLLRERLRAARRLLRQAANAWSRGWSTDVRHVARRLARAPGFVAVAILTLALGIGATSAIFSLAYAIWLKPLPYHTPDRLVVVQDVHRTSGTTASVSQPEIREFRASATSFAGMAAYRYGAAIAEIGGERVRLEADPVTPNLFDVLGRQPIVGRAFTADDVGRPVLVLSYATWVSWFGRDPSVLTRTFRLDDQAYSIVGVMPPDFRFSDTLPADAWVPSAFTERGDRSSRYDGLIGRLRPGVTIDAASRDVAAVAARLAQAYPDTNADWTAEVVPLDQRSRYGPVFGSLLGIVGLFLLAGCANLAGLLMARNTERRGELAVCASLGATRARLARQMMVEAVGLAAAGGAAGLALAAIAARALAATMPSRLPGVADVRLSLPVLAFSVAVAGATALVCSVVPAVGLESLSASEALTGPRRAGPRSHRLQSSLVVSEVAVAMLLVVGAGLMARSFADLLDRDRGFNPRGVLALNVTLPAEQPKYEDAAVRASALTGIVARVSRLPGVTHAGATNGFPGSPMGILGSAILHPANAAPGHDVLGLFRSATPDYFATMGVALRAGRTFRPDDDASAPRVIIVNETLAHRMWPDGHAVGRQLRLPATEDPQARVAWDVVGVVADMHLGASAPADIFFPVAQRPAFWIDLVLRTGGDPAALVAPVRRVLHDADRDLLVENSTPLAAIVAASVSLQRAQSVLAMVIAVLSALVAGVGLYALVAFAVARRAREFGIRLALGSSPRALSWWVFTRGMRLAALGVAAGALVTFVLVRLLRGEVFGFAEGPPAAYVASALVLLVVAALALLAPARRVLRVDPLVAIRSE